MAGVGKTSHGLSHSDHTVFWARTDTAAQCRAVIVERLGVVIATTILIAGFLYGISSLTTQILTEISPITIGLAATIILVFTWPVAILATLGIGSLYVLTYAVVTLRENKFPKNQWRVPGPLYYQQYIDRHLRTKKPEVVNKWASLIGHSKDLTIEPLFTVPVAKHVGTWYRVTHEKRTYNMLRVAATQTFPSTVINTHMQKLDTLPSNYQNGTRVHTNPELEKYLTITTIRGAGKEARLLLPPTTLQELPATIDSCDIELRANHIDFIWDEGTISDAVIDGRLRNIEAFLKTFLRNHRHDTAYGGEYLQPATTSKGFLGSIESVATVSGVITFVISLGTMYFAAGYYGDPLDILTFGAMSIIVGGLISICVSMTLAMLITAARSLRKTHYLLETARRIRHYALLYDDMR